MKKHVMLVVALAILTHPAVSFSEGDVKPAMPKKVRKFLDSTVGTWNITGTFEGTGSYRWDAGKGAVVGTGQWTNGEVSSSWTIMWHWDGASKDGVMATWTASDAADDGAVSQGSPVPYGVRG